MRTDLPQSQSDEAMELQTRALVELFKIDLRPPGGTVISLFLCPLRDETWQGKTWYSDTPCSISETSLNVTGEVSRPKFTIVNPNGVWSRYVHQKYADNAAVQRYRIRRQDVDDNVNAFQLSSWRMSKVISLSKDVVVMELRTVLDGQNFRIPAGTYRPPKYPTVSVQ